MAPFLIFGGLEVRLGHCPETAATILECGGWLGPSHVPRLEEYLAGVMADPSHQEVRVDLSRVWKLQPSGLLPILAACQRQPERLTLGAPPVRPVTRTILEKALVAFSAST